MLIIWSDLDLFRVWMSWMWTWTTWTWMTLTPLMLTWMMTSWMIKISPAHFRTYLNKKRDQTPPFPTFVFVWKILYCLSPGVMGWKKMVMMISHVLFSNKIDKLVYQSPFCTPLLIAKLCRMIEALCFSVPAKQNSFSLINCNCCTYSVDFSISLSRYNKIIQSAKIKSNTSPLQKMLLTCRTTSNIWGFTVLISICILFTFH